MMYSATNRINEKQTLRNLHEKFPQLNLDDLFSILDCITLETIVSYDYPTITTRDYNHSITAQEGAEQDYTRRFLK